MLRILSEPTWVLARTEIIGGLLSVEGVEMGKSVYLRKIVLMQNLVIIAFSKITLKLNRKFTHLSGPFLMQAHLS